MMSVYLFILVGYVMTAVLALVFRHDAEQASRIGRAGNVVGASLGIIPTVVVLLSGQPIGISLPWNVPFGTISLLIDPLSAVFLLPILVVSGVVAVYAFPYILTSSNKKRAASFWFFYNGLVASMALVVMAANVVLFLFAWEIMSVASFFLVTFDHQQKKTREAGWLYLASTHIGFLLIIVVLLALGGEGMALDFVKIPVPTFLPRVLVIPTSVLFLLTLMGFGFKAGFIPLHVWLPEAHPAAPSPVSALMSGVMIKTGIYGFLRVLTFLGPPEMWWGWLLVGLGVGSAMWGIASASAQHDFKKLLAYSSIENIGIIVMGLGIGILGMATQVSLLTVLGLTAALFHVYNHAALKSLLFLSAGNVAHATETREIDTLGGLLKKMPQTGWGFFFGAVGISGLPPLNGFMGELLLYLACFYGLTLPLVVAIPCLVVIAGLAVTGGLAGYCFCGLCGAIFLGEPRTEAARHGHEREKSMTRPLMILAALAVFMALFSPVMAMVFSKVIPTITGMPSEVVLLNIAVGIPPLRWVTGITIFLATFIVVFGCIRFLRQSERAVKIEETWGCGYASPTPRMQYTFSSFMQPLTRFLKYPLALRVHWPVIRGVFPRPGTFFSETSDIFLQKVFFGVYESFARGCLVFRRLQHGRLQFYVLYIALTLLILLLWKLS